VTVDDEADGNHCRLLHHHERHGMIRYLRNSLHLFTSPSNFKIVHTLQFFVVAEAKAVRALERWALAAVKDTALAAAMGPACAVGDRNLGAALGVALGAAAMSPAEPPRLGFGFALRDLALDRSA
jgi:hypothetical protein